MSLTTSPAPPDRAKDIAFSCLKRGDDMLERLMTWQRIAYREFWDSPETPDAILAAMGPAALPWLQSAGTFVDALIKLAEAATSPLAREWIATYILPRRAFAVDPKTGTVTLAPPADGFDAWGRAIEEGGE